MSAPVRKAVLLAAGKGTRMRELTNELPKPMIAVRGKPILLHIVEGLRAAGITHFLIVVGWRADVVSNYFGDGSNFGVSVEYATQVVQDGTGRVVELAKDFAGADPFVLSYGDILIEPANYRRLVELGDAEAFVSVKHNPGEIAKGGAIFVDESFTVTDVREKPGPDDLRQSRHAAGRSPHQCLAARWSRDRPRARARHRCPHRDARFLQRHESQRRMGALRRG